MKKIFLLLIFIFSLTGNSQDLAFTANVDTNRILIGEQINLQLKAEISEGSDFIWPFLPDTLSGMEMVSAGKLDTLSENGKWTLSQNLTLTSFDSGYAAIPPLTFSSADKSVTSQAIGIAVDFPKVEETQDYYDIKEPLEPPFNWMPIVLGILAVLALGGIITFLIHWLSERKKKKNLTPEQLLTPYEYAQKQLADLQKEQLWQSGKIKAYYSQLTDILRIYLERQMNINAMESTADELIEKMKILDLNGSLRQSTNEMLHLSALVKYAKSEPGAAEHEKALNTVKAFLEATKPQEKTQENNVELPV